MSDERTRTNETSDERSAADGSDGIYTGEQVSAGASSGPEQVQAAVPRTEHARLVGVEARDDGIVVTVELFDGRTEPLLFQSPRDARLDGDLRELFHYLGLNSQGIDELEGELIPVTVTEDGVVLDDLDIDPPPSNERSPPESATSLPGVLGVVQRYSSTLRTLEGVALIGVVLFLLLPLVLAGLAQVLGVGSDGFLGVVVAQLLVAVLLLAKGAVVD